MTENDESEILEEIEGRVSAPRADIKNPKPKYGVSIKTKLLIKVPKKESIADDELSDEETVEKIKPKAVRTQKQIDAFQKV